MTTRELQTKFLEYHFPLDFILSEETRKKFLVLGYHSDHKKKHFTNYGTATISVLHMGGKIKEKNSLFPYSEPGIFGNC
jgi:hypothetical protein